MNLEVGGVRVNTLLRGLNIADRVAETAPQAGGSHHCSRALLVAGGALPRDAVRLAEPARPSYSRIPPGRGQRPPQVVPRPRLAHDPPKREEPGLAAATAFLPVSILACDKRRDPRGALSVA